jgi:hypothetical protein
MAPYHEAAKRKVVMDRGEATGAAATAAILRELADGLEQGAIRVGENAFAVSPDDVSAVVGGDEATDEGSGGFVSTVTIRLVGRPAASQAGEPSEASELQRELAHPGG